MGLGFSVSCTLIMAAGAFTMEIGSFQTILRSKLVTCVSLGFSICLTLCKVADQLTMNAMRLSYSKELVRV